MTRTSLKSTVEAYPYLQGMWTIPLGIGIATAGLANLRAAPTGLPLVGLFGAGLLLAAAAASLISRHHARTYGRVTPTRQRQRRYGAAVVAWAAVLFVGANRYLWGDHPTLCLFATGFALATLVFYGLTVGVRAHHLVIWGLMAVAGLLPVWEPLGADRDALAMLPLGAALVASGLLDQRLVARMLGPARPLPDALETERLPHD